MTGPEAAKYFRILGFGALIILAAAGLVRVLHNDARMRRQLRQMQARLDAARATGPVATTAPLVHVECPTCREAIPVPIVVEITDNDDEDQQRIITDPDLTDLWAHAWTHKEDV